MTSDTNASIFALKEMALRLWGVANFDTEGSFSDTTVLQMCLDVEKKAHEVAERAYEDWSDGQ